MPQAANITVKKADGTTDVVYTVLAPSAGDRIAAKWRANSVNAIPAFRPTLEFLARPSSESVRRCEMALRYPIIQPVNSVDTNVFTLTFKGEVALPQGVPQDQVKEAIYQFGNLLVHSLIRQSLEDANAPT